MRLLYAILAAALILGGQGRAQAELADAITAIVHDSIITIYQVEDATVDMARQLDKQYRTQPAVFEKKMYEAQKEILDQMVEQQMILHDFETAGYNLPESIIDEQLEESIKARYGDRITLTKSLQQRGLTYEKFRKEYRDNFVIKQMVYKNAYGDIIISPHKIETYYVAHTNDFKVEDQVKLRMIILTNAPGSDGSETRKLAGEILAKINEGASFAEMASVYSQGSQRNQGGDWGWVDRYNASGATVLRKELADVAFNLKAGEKSGVIETPEACYLMFVEDRRLQHVRPLNDVRDEVEKILQAEEQRRLREQWIAKLKKKTFVRYFQ
jgi:peptidyl-prolyl cis-trans isomerase SurA